MVFIKSKISKIVAVCFTLKIIPNIKNLPCPFNCQHANIEYSAILNQFLMAEQSSMLDFNLAPTAVTWVQISAGEE